MKDAFTHKLGTLWNSFNEFRRKQAQEAFGSKYYVMLDTIEELMLGDVSQIYRRHVIVSKPFPFFHRMARTRFDPYGFDYVPYSLYLKLSNEVILRKIWLDDALRFAIQVLFVMSETERCKIDCMLFRDLYLRNNADFNLRYFDAPASPDIAVRKGDVINLAGFRENMNLGHSAICIDARYGLFLSVYGMGGELSVSTLEDMINSGWGNYGYEIVSFDR